MIKKFTIALTAAFMLIGINTAQANEVAPESVPGAETIDATQAKKLHDDGAMFIDLRTEDDYAKGHIPGAESLMIPSAFNQDSLEMLAEKDQAIVFYCYGVGCMRSHMASTRAVTWGYKNIKYFRAGLPAWKDAGYPIDK